MTAHGSVSRDLSDRLDFVGLGKAERAALRQAKPVITASLNQRFESRGLGTFTGKVLSAMRSARASASR